MPLRYLFLDMNAYFASVEQQDRPELRGRPIGIVPVMARSTCCIAASYEAKRFGVKTGTPAWEAERLCPGIRLVEARPRRYVAVHHQILEAVGRCTPIDRVSSIDEMSCRLTGDDRDPGRAAMLALRIKAELRAGVGEFVRCSIGIGPNVLLAKVGSDMRKPDGLTVIRTEDLPGALYPLKPVDFPGIGPRMERRLLRAGVATVRDLFRLTVRQLTEVWGSRVHGERWFFLLRGDDLPERPTRRRTVGHSHVLPPELRTEEGAYGVLSRLTHKAAARLRTIDYWAGAMSVDVRHADGSGWTGGYRFPDCRDTSTFLRVLAALWASRTPGAVPFKVGMVLWALVPARSATPSLFPEDRRSADLSEVMDGVNRACGRTVIHLGPSRGAEGEAPTRISFTQIPKFDPAEM